MGCITDVNILGSQLEHSLWKEWYGDENENWNGDDPGIQYDCDTESEQKHKVGWKNATKHINDTLRSMKDICEDGGKKSHNIEHACPDRIKEIQ